MKIYILTFLLSIGSLQAAQVHFVDNNTYTTDLINRLDWLDVTTTVGMSKRDVLAELNTGGKYDGWRYATRIEFMTMTDNFMSSPVTTAVGDTLHTDDKIRWLTSALGNYELTIHLGSHPISPMQFTPITTVITIFYTLGFLHDPSEILNNYSMVGNINYIQTGRSGSVRANVAVGDWITSSNRGSFLVRDTNLVQTPIPAAIWLMGTGLVGLLGFGRKNIASA